MGVRISSGWGNPRCGLKAQQLCFFGGVMFGGARWRVRQFLQTYV